MTKAKLTEDPTAPAEDEAPAASRREALLSASAMPPTLLEPEATAAIETSMETIDWLAIAAEASDIDPATLEAFEHRLDIGRKALGRAASIEVKSRKARNAALAALYGEFHTAIEIPGLVTDLAAKMGVKITKATTKSPGLPFFKVATPALDPKEQSAFAQCFNYALACEWSPAEFDAALEQFGAVELKRREAQRQKARKLLANDTPVIDPVEQFRSECPAFSLSDIRLPAEVGEAGLGLLIVGVAEGRVVAYDFDDDAKRLLSAIRNSTKRGRVLKSTSPQIMAAE